MNKNETNKFLICCKLRRFKIKKTKQNNSTHKNNNELKKVWNDIVELEALLLIDCFPVNADHFRSSEFLFFFSLLLLPSTDEQEYGQATDQNQEDSEHGSKDVPTEVDGAIRAL